MNEQVKLLTAKNIDRHIAELKKLAIENERKMIADDFMNAQQLMQLHTTQQRISDALMWLIRCREINFPSKLVALNGAPDPAIRH